MIHLLILLSFLLFGPHQHVGARFDPKSVPNNRFGIHIVEMNDLSDAATLVNSSGGDWGYVTLVIQEDDRDSGKWQNVFNRLRALHLIPIVRIATHIDGDRWVKPYADSALDWARFLNSLNWPVENRYVVVYNEPNHANEWGNSIDPEDYAHTLIRYARTFKDTSEDFFILPAGLDVSAASDSRSLDAAAYLSRMLKAEPELFTVLDGWTSHAYPNPGFSGSPYATGRGTLFTYQWERALLRQLGIQKNLPIFITETGWVHSQGVTANYGLLSPEQVGANLTVAASNAWTDPDIIAVTPFVLNYQGLPFDHFSWRRLDNGDYYPFYERYRSIPKRSGEPPQRQKYTLDHPLVPKRLVAGSVYVLSALMKNEGQGILSQQDMDYRIQIDAIPPMLSVSDPLPVMEPGQYGTLTMHLETPNVLTDVEYAVQISHRGRKIPVETGSLTLVPPPAINVSVMLGWTKTKKTEATVLVYDGLTLIHKMEGVQFLDGKATVRDLRNVVPGNTYRVVVVVPYYLPRQSITKLQADMTDVKLPRMYPIDFNRDGALTGADVLSGIRALPQMLINIFFGH